MFLPFRIQKNEISRLTNIDRLLIPRIQANNEEAIRFLQSKIDFHNGCLDGDVIKSGWLPTDKHYDMFISYSHNDEGEALKLVAWLEKKGVKCFIDSCYWKSADVLLQAIDKAYCLNPSGDTFDYRKRNYSTSLIHALLSMAIMEAIDHCDFALFVESNNSTVLNIGDISTFTLSPWIYEELNMLIKIEKHYPSWLQKSELKMFSEGGNLTFENNLSMQFSIPINQLKSITAENLNKIPHHAEEWLKEFYHSLYQKELLSGGNSNLNKRRLLFSSK